MHTARPHATGLVQQRRLLVIAGLQKGVQRPMESSRQQSPVYPYPTVRRSGLDVLLIGLVTIAAALVGWSSGQFPLHPGIFFPGFIAAIAIFLAFKRRLTIGVVTPAQQRLIRGALSLEGVLIILAWLAVRDITSRTFWLLVLLAVGSHFFPFVRTAGPLIGILGALTIINAGVGLLLGGVPFVVFGLIHGTLAAIFGGLMLATRPPSTGRGITGRKSNWRPARG